MSQTPETKAPPAEKKRRWRVSRRGFLIGLGATAGVLAVGVKVGIPAVRLQVAGLLDGAGAPFGVEASPTTWFEITSDNQVILMMPKVEMGQGIHTTLSQIAAEELEIEWQQIQVQQASTLAGPQDSGGTGASSSTSSLYTPLREAAATMREMLRTEAAQQLGLPASELVIASGIISPKTDSSKSLTYGEIVANKTGEWEVPEEAPALKPREKFKFIGNSQPRVDLLDKITGKAVYGYDARVPGMLYGAVARPPTLEAKLISASEGNARNLDGIVDVVIDGDFVGVVAESRAQAYGGVYSLDLEWDEGTLWQQEDIIAMNTVGNGKPTVIQKEGNTNSLEKDNSLIAEYRTPMAAHAHLEAQASLVDVQPDKITAWVSTQFPNTVQGEIAEAIGREAEEVEVTPTYLGGGFGRKLNVEVAVESARLSNAVGRPVHVGWDRTEDLRYGYFRPPTHNVLRAKLDDNGRLQAIQHHQASGDVAFGFLPGFFKVVAGADFGAWRGSMIPYAIPNINTTAWRIELPVPTGWWRGLGLLANVFATESFMDEAAHTAGIDPLQFRLNHLSDDELGQRFRKTLQAAADKAGWDTPPPAGRGRGIAVSVDVGTVVAEVAEVSVVDGQIRVHKVTAAMDPGMVINPDGAIAQTQGAIIMGMSSVFNEELTIKDGHVVPSNFDKYPLITMDMAPDIDVVLLESGSEPFGIGEPPIGPIAAAIANAVFAATGQRLRQLPLKL